MSIETSVQVHIYGNFFTGLLCLLAFFSVLEKIRASGSNRGGFSVFLALLFLFMSVGFMTLVGVNLSLHTVHWEFLWQVGTLLMILAYLMMLWRNRIIFDAEDPESSRHRFDRMKDEFLSVASHELRTPLSVINGFAEILVREKLGPLNDEQKRRVRKILLQGQRLNRIIDELLDLSRIRSGKIECRSEVFDLVPVLKAALDDHQIVCEQQKLELVDDIPDILPDVVGDLERVTQVIVNLLNNAIKYTEPGGKITMGASYDKDRKEVAIHLADSGIGIAKDDLQKIFEEFYRARQGQAKKYAGSGLGLTIVKQLVEAMGGRVLVKSEGLGQGSTFSFTLPTTTNGRAPASHFIKPLNSRK